MEHTYIQKQKYLKYSAQKYEVPTIRKALCLELGSIFERALTLLACPTNPLRA